MWDIIDIEDIVMFREINYINFYIFCVICIMFVCIINSFFIVLVLGVLNNIIWEKVFVLLF